MRETYGESSGDGEEDDLLALPLVGGVLDGYRRRKNEISFDRGRSSGDQEERG